MSDQESGAGHQGWTPPPSAGAPPPPGSVPPPPPGAPPGGWPPPPGTPGGWQQPSPQGWAPPPAPTSSGGSGCLTAGVVILGIVVLMGVLAVVGILVVGSRLADNLDRDPAKASDYELDEGDCTVSEFGSIEATGTITNTSDKNRGFEIEYRFIDPDGTQLDVDSTYTDDIPKGRAATYRVIGAVSDAPQGSTCELRRVLYGRTR